MENTIFCFCHWGGENVVSADGSILYKGGITDSFHAHGGMTFEEFKLSVFDRLKLNPEGKLLHFTVKYDPKQLILLKDDIGVQTLIACNDEFAHVYVSISESCIASSSHVANNRLPIGSNSNLSIVEPFLSQTISEPLMTTDEPSQLFIRGRWKEIITGVGQVFEDANFFREAVYKFSIAHRFSYKFTHNKPKFLKIECAIDGCPWKITASGDGNASTVSVRKMEGTHTHSIGDVVNFKPKVRAKLVGNLVIDKLFNTPTYLPRQMCKDVMDEYQVYLTYHQAWLSKEKALQVLDGNVEDSYKLIPWYCNRLMEVLPDTIATWSCYDDGTFKQLFVSYGCSIHGFHIGCRPIVFIDGCHLSGPYKGTLLSASSLDAGNGMYPLAYGVVTSECEEDWMWFLQHLKDVIKDKDVVIVSDRNPAILKGVDVLFKSENHAHCYRHLQENFSSFINKSSTFRLTNTAKKRAQKILDEIAYARTMDSYDKAVQKLLDFHPKLHEWVIKNNPEHWSNALFPKQRWDWLNSNIAECFNAWMGEARFYPIGKMMQAHATKYSQLLLNKVNDLLSWKHGIGKRIEDRLTENISRGQGLSVKPRPPSEVEIFERRKGAIVVNLSLHSCTCMEWQMTGIPCPHACRAIQNQNCNIYDCISDCYKMEVQEKIYAELMPGIPTVDMPLANDLPIASVQEGNMETSSRCALLPPRTKRPPGRPRKRRIESQFINRRPFRCSRCHNIGHNRSTCRESL